MKVKQLLPFLFSVICLFYACDKKCEDCLPVNGQYSKGIFVVNEGPWGGTGTISWYDPSTGEVQDSIFEKANNGARLGQFVQSLTFYKGKGYIVVNGTNRVVIVDAETFVFLDTIGGLELPRYFLPINDDIAYVSQWGLDGVSGSVAKINLNTNTIQKTTATGSGPEKMLFCEESKYLYIANSGGYGVDSTVTSIAIENNDQIVANRVITGQKNPCCLTKNNTQGFVPWFVMCKGDWADPDSQGWLGLGFINPITGSMAPKGCDDLVGVPNGPLYFSSGTAIYKVKSGGASDKLFDQPAYCLAVHPTNGNLYCGDAKDFNSNGAIVIRNPEGAILNTFRAGIAPGEIVIVE